MAEKIVAAVLLIGLTAILLMTWKRFMHRANLFQKAQIIGLMITISIMVVIRLSTNSLGDGPEARAIWIGCGMMLGMYLGVYGISALPRDLFFNAVPTPASTKSAAAVDWTKMVDVSVVAAVGAVSALGVLALGGNVLIGSLVSGLSASAAMCATIRWRHVRSQRR